LQGDAYFNQAGPLDPAWRDGDSVWSLSPPEELAAACIQFRETENEGPLAAYVADHDAARLSIGQITYLCAIRR
jgi:hypothetical protein